MNRSPVHVRLLTSVALLGFAASPLVAQEVTGSALQAPPLAGFETAVALDPATAAAMPETTTVAPPALSEDEARVALGNSPASAAPTPAAAIASIAVPALREDEALNALGDMQTETTAALGDTAPVTVHKPIDPTASALYADAVRMAVGEALAAGLDAPRGEANAIAAFYAANGNGPVWTADGHLAPLALKVIERLGDADADGLSASAYAVPEAAGLAGIETEAALVASVELNLSRAIITYARHAAGGRIDGNALSKNVKVDPHSPDPFEVLTTVAGAADPAAVLDGYNPTHAGFQALRRKLGEIRAAKQAIAEAEPEPIIVPAGPLIKPGMADPRVAVLRQRLGLTMSDSETYDEALVDAVRSFQKESRIRVTGIVGPQTLAALNGETGGKSISDEDEIIANMERWRWLPRELGAFHVFVNVPEYEMKVRRNGVTIHESRVIVGKPGTQTPIFSDVMEYVVVNPSWHVPASIIRKEFLPKLQQDPTYLTRKGFVVTAGGRKIDPTQIDWSQGLPRIAVRQPPGDSNALGHIKFMFPNEFSVYLHDTSTRKLFASERRSYSHGCVRVDQPFRFAEIVMGAEHGWSEERVRKMIGGREQRIDLKDQPLVHLAYFTAKVDEATGELVRFEDLYGYDRRVHEALKALN